LREIWSDDLGKSWDYGHLGAPEDGKYYNVMQGSGINAVVVPNSFQLRVYFSSDDSGCLAVAWMPIVGDVHSGDWNLAPNLYKIDGPW
jgi:hypothetical protein